MDKIEHKVSPDGTEEWFRDGRRHRENGPAVIYPGGSEIWYLNGKRHREDGPAQIYSDGLILWFLNDRSCSFDKWCDELTVSKERRIEFKLIYG